MIRTGNLLLSAHIQSFLASLAALMLVSACSGQAITPSATPPPTAVPTNSTPNTTANVPATLVPPAVSADCKQPDKGQAVVATYIARYNAKDVAGALDPLDLNIKQYIDPLYNVSYTNPTRPDMTALLQKRFENADTLTVTNLKASADPVAVTNQYIVSGRVERIDKAGNKSAGELSVAVECRALKITLLAMITGPAK